MKIAMILLAAGNSRRFESNKLLYEIQGKPMYLHILEKLAKICREGQPAYLPEGNRTAAKREKLNLSLTVVTQYEEVEAAARGMGATVLYNPHPERGISSSLKIGLKENQDADACLFAVADQPWLSKETLKGLLELFIASGKGIACVAAGEKKGNPCVFSGKYYPELLALTGDVGGKRVLSAHPEDVAYFETGDEELSDIDRKP